MILARAKKTRGPRKSVQQPGWLIFEGSFAARPCTVIDLSETGAKIQSGEPSAVRTKLRLAFSRGWLWKSSAILHGAANL